MASIRCNNCGIEKDHSEFLRDPLNLRGKLLKTCSTCRASNRAAKKRAAENSLPTQPARRRRTLAPSEAPLQPAGQSIAQTPSDAPTTLIRPGKEHASTPINPPILPDPNIRPTSSTDTTRSPPAPSTRISPVSTLGFLPQWQWNWIQGFHVALTHIKMEDCSRCKER
jgi:hypothetical protein